jgi:cytochrome c oxidase cbb3-type subunit III
MMKRTLLTTAALFWLSLPAMAQRAAPPPVNPYHAKAPAIQQGEAIYVQSCTPCHGLNGTDGVVGPALGAAGHEYSRRIDTQIFDAIKNGMPGTGMSAFGARLSDDDIWKVTAYIDALRGTAIDTPLAGDVAHGEAVFFDKGGCASCHRMHGEGGLIGPDLSSIADLRKASSISDALTKVNHHVYGPGGNRQHVLVPIATYQPVTITSANGAVTEGVIVNQDSFSIQVMGKDNQLHLFDRATLKNIVYQTKSLMPTDYDKRLTPDEFKDLMAFLTHQGTSPTAAPAGRRGGAPPP